MRYSIKLSYNGASFHGWQIQANDISVQESLEKALSILLRSDISITGAGRTDAEVNAIGYIAHFEADTAPNLGQLCYKLNAILPNSIVIHSIEEQEEGFHARFDAKSREYTYFIHRRKDPFLENFSYLCQYPELDFELMNKAASLLIGRHDFRCFEKAGADCKTSICTVFSAYWEEYKPCPAAWDGEQGDYWRFKICANRFLRNMVRAVVGTLLEVGRDKRSLESFGQLILDADCAQDRNTSSRSLAGESVPGKALFLNSVRY